MDNWILFSQSWWMNQLKMFFLLPIMFFFVQTVCWKVEFEVEWFSHAIWCFALQCNATMFMSSLILTWALQKYKDLIKVVYIASAAVVKLGETSFLPTFDRHDEWFSGYSLKSYWWSNLLGNFMIKLLIQ